MKALKEWSGVIAIIVTILGSAFGLFLGLDSRVDAVSEKLAALDIKMEYVQKDVGSLKADNDSLMALARRVDNHILIVRKVMKIPPHIADTVGLTIYMDMIAAAKRAAARN